MESKKHRLQVVLFARFSFPHTIVSLYIAPRITSTFPIISVSFVPYPTIMVISSCLEDRFDPKRVCYEYIFILQVDAPFFTAVSYQNQPHVSCFYQACRTGDVLYSLRLLPELFVQIQAGFSKIPRMALCIGSGYTHNSWTPISRSFLDNFQKKQE